MDMRLSFALLVAAATVVCSACGSSTETHCSDPSCGWTSLTFQTPGNTWASGTYALTLTSTSEVPVIDRPLSATCTIQAAAQATSAIAGTCDSLTPVSVSFLPIYGPCASAPCGPLPGQFALVATLDGMPDHLDVALTTNGATTRMDIAPPVSRGMSNCGVCANAAASIRLTGI
jgi:ribosomal protein L32